jgi:hypothetical protein
MFRGNRIGLSAEQKAQLWIRWKAGQSLHEIGRAFGKEHASIHFLLAHHGGIAPAARRRSPLTLTLAEREDISRGIACGSRFVKSPNASSALQLRRKRWSLAGSFLGPGVAIMVHIYKSVRAIPATTTPGSRRSPPPIWTNSRYDSTCSPISSGLFPCRTLAGVVEPTRL